MVIVVRCCFLLFVVVWCCLLLFFVVVWVYVCLCGCCCSCSCLFFFLLLLSTMSKQPFSTASVACGCCRKTASKKAPAAGKTPCLWRTSKFQNHAKKLPNVTSEIVEKQPFSTASVACGCCRKTASKKSPAGGKTPRLWRTSKFQNHAKKVPITSLLKSWKNNLFRQLLLPAAAAVKQLRKNHLPGGKTPCLWRTSKFQNHAKKVPNATSEILEKQHFSTASVACGCCRKTASKKSPAGGKTPCLWRTGKFQNHAKKLPTVTSEILEKQPFFDSFCCLRLLQ